METKANHILIGAFILLATLLGFAFVFWIQNYGTGTSVNRYYVLFKGPVTGLAPASNVLFNGLKVGKIEDFKIDPDDPRNTRVLITIKRGIPIRHNSYARIVSQGLSAYSSVMITPGTPDEQLLVALDDGNYPVINAAPGGGASSMFEAAPKVLDNANTVLRRVDELIANNEKLVRDTLKNLEGFTRELDKNKDKIASLMSNADQTALSASNAAKKAEKTFETLDKLLADNGKKVGELINDIALTAKNSASFSRELDNNKDKIASLMNNADQTVIAANKAAQKAGDTIGRLDKLVADNEKKIGDTIASIAKTAKNAESFSTMLKGNEKPVSDILASIRTTSQNAEKFSAMLTSKESDVAAIIDNVRSISEQFKGTATKLETVLDGLSGFMSNEDGTSMMTEISAAATSFKTLAEKLDKSLGNSAEGMARFAKGGLREFEGLMREGRRMVKAMERVMNKIERNPQGLLFGAKSVREYKSN